MTQSLEVKHPILIDLTDTVDTKSRQVNLVTLRFPTPARYSKMYGSLRKRFDAKLLTGTVVPTIHLRLNMGTVWSYVSLFGQLLRNGKPAVIDINALTSARLNLRNNVVVDFRTPLSLELNWLGHGLLATIARTNERILKNVGLVTAANEHMAKYCSDLGAKNVQIIPNYPKKDFKPSILSKQWRAKNNLSQHEPVVLFTGGVRVKEIYGAGMLLESWKLIEKSTDSATLVILGDDSIDYIKQKSKALNLKRLILPGLVKTKDVANWINCADVCIAPRTPGFSDAYYNDKDSTKISEYAALEKPIVATSYAPSEQYLLVDPTPAAFAEGIMKGLDGKIKRSKAHFWEENEFRLLQSLEDFWFS